MPASAFGEGDVCYLDLLTNNPGEPQAVDLYALLEVSGSYWCYPSWAPLATGLDYSPVTVAEGLDALHLIPGFVVPPVSPAGPLYFYAAMFEPGTLSLDTLVSNGAVWEFRLAD